MLPAAQSLPHVGVVCWARCTAADLPGCRTAYSLHCWLLLSCLPIGFTPADPWCAVHYTRLELKGHYTVLRSVVDGSSFSVLAQEGPLVGAVIAANASNWRLWVGYQMRCLSLLDTGLMRSFRTPNIVTDLSKGVGVSRASIGTSQELAVLPFLGAPSEEVHFFFSEGSTCFVV